MRLIRDGEKGGGGISGGWGLKREIANRYTVQLEMIPALRWAAMRATDFNVSVGSDGQSHKTVSTNGHILSGATERRAEAVLNRDPGFRLPA